MNISHCKIEFNNFPEGITYFLLLGNPIHFSHSRIFKNELKGESDLNKVAAILIVSRSRKTFGEPVNVYISDIECHSNSGYTSGFFSAYDTEPVPFESTTKVFISNSNFSDNSGTHANVLTAHAEIGVQFIVDNITSKSNQDKGMSIYIYSYY